MLDLLKFDISSRDRASASFSKLRAELGTVKGTLAGVNVQARRAGQALRNMGAATSLAVTAPIALAGRSVLQAAGDYEQALNNVRALSGATEASMKSLDNQARELGATTKFSASQAADAMGFLAMAGFRADQIIGAMPSTLQLAAAAGADLATSADIVSNILSGFGLEVDQLAGVNDVLVKTMTSANTDLRMLGDAMKYVGPVAASAGMRFNEVAAAIGLLGNAGIQGEMGGTALRGIMTRLLNPSKEAASAMAELGVSVLDSSGKLRSLAEIMQEFAPHADKTGVLMEIFGQRAGPAFAALLSVGSGALTEFEQKLNDAGGTAERIANTQMQGFNGQVTALRSALEGLAIAIGASGVLQLFTDLANKVTELVRSLSASNPEILRWGAIVAGLAAAIGPAIAAIGLLSLGIGALSGPIGIIALLVAAGGAAFVTWAANARDAGEAAYDAEKGSVALNNALGVFYATAAPSAGKAAIDLANDNYRLAESAIYAAEAELAKRRAALDAANALQSGQLDPRGRKNRRDSANREYEEAVSVLDRAQSALDKARRDRDRAARAVTGSSFTPPKAQIDMSGVGDSVSELSDKLSDLLKGAKGAAGGVGSIGKAATDIKDPAAAALDALKERNDRLKSSSENVNRSFAGTFSSIVRGSEDAASAVSKLLDSLADQILTNTFTSLFGKLGLGNIFAPLVTSAQGNVFAGGRLVPFASGGIVSSPTYFPMRGGTGLMGEAGPEAIMPLSRGSDGRLGVRASGGSAAGRVRIEIVEAPGFAATVRTQAQGVAVEEIRKAQPTITAATLKTARQSKKYR